MLDWVTRQAGQCFQKYKVSFVNAADKPEYTLVV